MGTKSSASPTQVLSDVDMEVELGAPGRVTLRGLSAKVDRLGTTLTETIERNGLNGERSLVVEMHDKQEKIILPTLQKLAPLADAAEPLAKATPALVKMAEKFDQEVALEQARLVLEHAAMLKRRESEAARNRKWGWLLEPIKKYRQALIGAMISGIGFAIAGNAVAPAFNAAAAAYRLLITHGGH